MSLPCESHDNVVFPFLITDMVWSNLFQAVLEWYLCNPLSHWGIQFLLSPLLTPSHQRIWVVFIYGGFFSFMLSRYHLKTAVRTHRYPQVPYIPHVLAIRRVQQLFQLLHLVSHFSWACSLPTEAQGFTNTLNRLRQITTIIYSIVIY